MTGEERYKQIGYKQYLLQALKDDKPHIKVLALFALLKGVKFDSYQQLQFYITRNLRPAQRLTAFPLKRIKDVYQYCQAQFGDKFKIGLETIEKYILEDIEEFSDKEAIIILKSGERIYDIKKIKKLEQEKKIRYSNNKWIEI